MTRALLIFALLLHTAPALAQSRDDPDAARAQVWVGFLDHKDDAVRRRALQALQKLGQRATSASKAVVSVLEDDAEPTVRVRAAEALGAIGATDPAVVTALSKQASLTTTPQKLRIACVRALGTIGPPAKAAVGALVGLLRDPDLFLRHNAATSLGKLKSAAASAIPTLVRLLESPGHPVVRESVALALGQMGKASALPALTRTLTSKVPDLRAAAARALGHLGPTAASAVADLGKSLAHPTDAMLRWRSAQALGRIGPAAKSALTALGAAVSDASRDVRLEVIACLVKLGAVAKPAIPALRQRLTKERDATVRDALFQAIASINVAKVDKPSKG